MPLKSWSAFHQDVLMSVPGCPVPVVDHMLRLAAIDLCSRSRRLRIDMPAFDTVADTPIYPLAPGDGMETVRIEQASIDGTPIDPVRRAELATIDQWATESGTPTRYLLVGDDETVRLWRTPNAVYSVGLTLSIKPSLTATGIEQWFGDRYREAIVSGALASMMAIPKKDWTDGALSAYHNDLFRRGVITATADAEKDGTSAPLRTVSYGRA